MSDAESFDVFYRSTHARTLQYLYACLGDAADAQDVAQEAFGKAWRSWPDVSQMTDPEAWVRTVGWRIAANHVRHLRVVARRRLRADALVSGPPSDDNVTLIAALKRLEPAQRQALVLYYLLDLPVQQIAAEAGISLSAAKARLVRGRTALAALLGPVEEVSRVRPT